MLEVTCIVDPLSLENYQAVEFVIDYIKKYKDDCTFRIVPSVFTDDLDNLRDDQKTAMRISMDFTAMQLQGNKAANIFFQNLEKEILIKNQEYRRELVQEIAEQINISTEYFLEQRLAIENARATLKKSTLLKQYNIKKPVIMIKAKSYQSPVLIDNLDLSNIYDQFESIINYEN